MGLLDARKYPIEVKYFQSAPFTEEDNRVNRYTPTNDLKYKLVCDYSQQLSASSWDNHLFWQSHEDVCPEEMMDEFIEQAEDSKFLSLLTEPTLSKRLSLLNVASKYIVCATKYMRSYVPYSHGYGTVEAGVWLHFLIEWVPSLLRPFLENSDLNSFNIDYIYEKGGDYSDKEFMNPPSSNPSVAPTNSPCDDNSPISGSEDWWFCKLHSNTYKCNDGESCCCKDGFEADDDGDCVACGSQIFQESTAQQVFTSSKLQHQAFVTEVMNFFAVVGAVSVVYLIWKRCSKKNDFIFIPQQEI